MKCSSCGHQLEDNFDVEFSACPECGAQITPSTDNPTAAKVNTCETCGEELEYITTYQQWYCYNCQIYVDLPEPSSAEPELEPELEAKLESESEPEQKPEIEEDTGSIIEPSSTLSLSQDQEENVKEPAEQSDIQLDDSTSMDIDETQIDDVSGSEPVAEEELSWDDAIEPDSDFADAGDQEEELESEPELDKFDDLVSNEEDSDVDFSIDLSQTDLESDTEPGEEFIMAGPIAGVDPIEDNIENLSLEQIELEIDQDYEQMEDEIEITDHTHPGKVTPQDIELKNKALKKLHLAWLNVNNLKGMNPKDPRVLQLEEDLKRALEGDFDPRDGIILAEESIEETEKLAKEIKESVHQSVSDLFHFVNSKIFLAKKIGFNLDVLEEDLDNITSLIARSEYHHANSDLEACLQKIYDLPKTQDEIMIGLDSESEIIKELTEPYIK